MQIKKLSPLWIFCIIILAGLVMAGFTYMQEQYQAGRLQREPLDLQVPALAQSQTTSCGEAAITMAYNYAYPETPVNEQQVIEYAQAQGYFTEELAPFTSPANMLKIARHYAQGVSSGTVVNSSQGLALLFKKLQDGQPVIVDVLSNFTDPESEAHFVVVTGISVDVNREGAIVIQFNDPLSGTKKSADWAGNAGVWNAWQNNGDPGGPGWWLVIPVPR